MRPDALLEFEPERQRAVEELFRPKARQPASAPITRPSESLLEPPKPPASPVITLDDLSRKTAAHDAAPRRSLKMNPMLGFALGVAGLVTAAMAYYQMFGLITSQKRMPAETAAAPAAVSTPAPPTTGRLEITSEPSGASVSVDGQARGTTPLVLAGLAVGPHSVVIRSDRVSVTRAVTIEGGATASVVATLAPPTPPPAPVEGWVSFDTKMDLLVVEHGRVVGRTRAGRVAFPPGVHELELVNDAFDVRQAVTISVIAGRSTRSSVMLPMGSLSVNALPWAEVWVNGESVGMTPLANLAVPVGSHEITWRHPTLGERRQVVVVKAQTPVRVGVDFAK